VNKGAGLSLMSNALVIVDLEGCAGVTERDRHTYNSPKLRALMATYRETCTGEVLACVEGLRSAGFLDVHVYEGHADAVSDNFLPAGVSFSSVKSEPCFLHASWQHWDAVVLVGSHAAERTPNATLAHTMSIQNPQVWRINGLEAGETGIQATMLAVKDSPIRMVTGGVCLANEVGLWCLGARHVVVKRDEGWNRAASMPEREACKLIRAAASELEVGFSGALPVKPPYFVELCFCGGSVSRHLFRTLWLLKRRLLKKPYRATYRMSSGCLGVRGDDPRLLVNAILGRELNV
jgi:D-amino peptidase